MPNLSSIVRHECYALSLIEFRKHFEFSPISLVKFLESMSPKNNARKERSTSDKSQYLDVECDEYFCNNEHFVLAENSSILTES